MASEAELGSCIPIASHFVLSSPGCMTDDGACRAFCPAIFRRLALAARSALLVCLCLKHGQLACPELHFVLTIMSYSVCGVQPTSYRPNLF